MHSLLGSLGTAGLAVALTVLLWLGTTSGGKIKPLGWGVCLALSMIAGAAFKAAGTPFDLISNLVNDLVGLTGQVVPGFTMPAFALTMLIVILFKRLTTRQVAMLGVVFWYIASGAGGAWGILASKIALIAHSLT